METINLNGNVYVTGTLLEDYGFTKDDYFGWLNRNAKKQTDHFEHFKDEFDPKKYWIKYQTIPLDYFKKYKLPVEAELYLENETLKREKIEALIVDKLLKALNYEFIEYRKYYHGLFYDIDSIHKYAKLHAFYHACYQLNNMEIESKDIYKVYKDWNFGDINLKASSTFYRNLKKFKETGGDNLVHGAYQKSRGSSKINDQVLSKIESLYRNKKQFTGHKIHAKLNEWCRQRYFEPVSLSLIKSIITTPEFMNKNKVYRYGGEWAQMNFEHYRLRNDPDYNGSLWQIDGTRIQIPYLKNKREAYLYIFVVMDVKSRKIVGYSVDETEQNEMIIKAIKSAVRTTKYLPKEILRDNGKPFESANYQYLEKYMNFLGSYSRKHPVGSPRDKGHVERFFGTFQTMILKNYDGYIGEGIRGRRENSRPAEEVIKEYRKTKNLRSKDELLELIDEGITTYNTSKGYLDKPSPQSQFEISKTDPNSIQITSTQFALLFWKRTSIKVKNSMIIMTEGNGSRIKHQYLIHDEKLRLRLNLTNVTVCYLKSDRQVIKLFDDNERWITDLEKVKPLNPVRDRPRRRSERPIFENINSERVEKVSDLTENKRLFKSEGNYEEIK